MEKLDLGQHISQQFNAELEDVRNRVMTMGGLVERQLEDAIEALTTANTELGESVITNDYKVNAMEVAIDEECNQILARRQPAAGDLRLIVAVIKTITDLERIGDLAERVGRMATRLGETGESKAPKIDMRHLGSHVKQMLHDALDAFARMDAEAAVNVAKQDPKADKEYEGLIRQLITYMMEDPRTITPCLDYIWAARALERIGDHAGNICEYIVYLVRGKDVRHTSLEQMEKAAHENRR
jgi:phosphate transport system protein